MYKKPLFYCVPPQWHKNLAQELGTAVVNETTLILPEVYGKGHCYFIQVMPGIAAMFFDFTLKSPIKINWKNDIAERYIFHFDISDSENQLFAHNAHHKIGFINKLGLSIFNIKGKNYFEPNLGNRTFALSLFVDKKLLTEIIENDHHQKAINQNINFSEKKLFHSTEIDGDSLLLLTALKEMSIYTVAYDTNLRGLSLKLLVNTLLKLAETDRNEQNLSKTDIDALETAKEYLSANLHDSFPSIEFLSKIAGMSTTKFKDSFKKYFQTTSKNFFIQEKMILAKKLLQSGNYVSVTEIIRELNYEKSDQFTATYFNSFRRKPIDDFVKKK